MLGVFFCLRSSTQIFPSTNPPAFRSIFIPHRLKPVRHKGFLPKLRDNRGYIHITNILGIKKAPK
jgi:hypothetical protein